MSYIQCFKKVATGALLSVTMGVGAIAALPMMGAKTVASTAVAQVTFRDIGGHPYQAEIRQAAELGLIKGFPEDGTFRPDATVTREQAVAIILSAIGVTQAQVRGLASPFRDVPESRWSSEIIAYAARNNIVAGRGGENFVPADTVTRAELMAMLRKVADSHFAGRSRSTAVNFSDTANHWANETIAYMSSYCGVATPINERVNERGNNFAPNLGATRGYTAAAIVRLVDCGRTTASPRMPTSPSPVATPASPDAAYIYRFGGTRRNVLVRADADAAAREVGENLPIYDGGTLEVRDSSSWAAFGFRRGDQRYEGFWARSNGRGFYRFRCGAEGNFFFGWSADSSTCNAPGQRLTLYSASTTSQLLKPLAQIAGTLGIGTKQQNTPSGVLLVDPIDGAPTLIETQFDGTYTINVFQGSIEVKSDESSTGITVNAGEQYIHFGGDASTAQISSIDVASCPALGALNSSFAFSPETSSDDFSRAIADQLRQHQQALGLLGTPATLSPYEQAIVDEINRARSNPRAYAQELQQFFESGGPSASLYWPAYSDWPSQNSPYSALPDNSGWNYLVTSEFEYDYVAAVNLLNGTDALPPLSTSAGLSLAARDFVEQNSASGEISLPSGQELGQYGSHPCEQIQQYGVHYGELLEPKRAVMQLLANSITNTESVTSLRYAPDLLSPELSVIGLDCAAHPTMQGVCNLILSDSFLENGP